MKKRRYIRFLAAILVGTLAFPVWAEPVNRQDLEEAEKQKSIYEQELQKAQDLISSLQDSKTDVISYIQQLDGGINDLMGRVQELEAEEEKKKQEVKAAQDELSRITEEKDQQYEAMKLRIKYMYEMGESDYLEILFSSGSLTDLFNQAEYISQISAYDRRMLEKYQQTVELVENSATALMQEQLQLENLQAEEQAKMASMQVLHDAKSKELSGIENMLADNEELREQYQQGLKNQEYTIEKLEQAMREEEERALQMALQASREAEAASIAASKSEAESISQSIEESIAQSIAQAQSSSGPGSGENQVDPDSPGTASPTPAPTVTDPAPTEPSATAPSGDTSEFGSRPGGAFYLKWPCPSSRRITSPFGPRPNKPVEGVSDYHNGIDVGAAYGAEIVAAADGVVTSTEYNIAGGNMIYISHENGKFITSYLHMSRYIVSPGQTVKAGQVVGYVGSTGYSTGPHLDFRLITGGQHINPLGSNISYQY